MVLHPNFLDTGADTFEAQNAVLRGGQGLMVVTDGILESRSPAGELFGTERLINLLRPARGESARAMIQRVLSGVAEFRLSRPWQDDATVLTMKYR